MKKTLFALAIATVTLGVGASQLLAITPKAPDFVVDQGTVQCKNPNFTTSNGINLAIAAAAVGKTIKVCPGSYTAVTVTKKVTLNGTAPLVTAAQCIAPATTPATDVNAFPVVEGGFAVDGVDDVKISQFTIQHAATGVHTTAATDGLTLTKNIVQNNTIGVYLNGGTAVKPSKVNGNCIRRNNQSGASAGSGIYTDQGLAFAQITKNAFYSNNNGGNGGAFNGAAGPMDSLFINGNSSNSDANFVSLAGATNSEISGNNATNTSGGAVFLDGDNWKVNIVGNTFTLGQDDGIGLGGGTNPNEQILIQSNSITSNSTDGIDTNADSLIRSVISQNTISSNGTRGIALVNSGNTGNFVLSNKVTTNGAGTADNCVENSGNNATWYANNAECTP